MKECKFCGMPLESDAAQNICDYCINDDLKEVLNGDEEDEIE